MPLQLNSERKQWRTSIWACIEARALAMALTDSLGSLSKRWQREAVKQADLVSLLHRCSRGLRQGGCPGGGGVCRRLACC